MMKKKIILILAVFLAIGIDGCKKTFLNLQTNPNAPSSATPQFLLSGALVTTASIVNRDYSEYGVWSGYWVSSGNYVPSPQLQQYSFTTDNYNGQWTDLYDNLSNYHALITQSTGVAALANFQAIATIMTAFDFQALVDNFNNVPYSQAFEPTVTITPAYDNGSAIYDDLLKKLDAAIALINANPSATNPAASDVVFGGNMTEWVKFANTIKLRIAVRQYETVPSKDAALKASIAATASDGYIDGTFEADVNPGYANVDANGGQQSPFILSYGFNGAGNSEGGNIYYRANNYALNLLNKDNDPRLAEFYLPLPSNGTIAGLDFGTSNPQANTFVSAIGDGLLKSQTMNAVVLSSAESLFLQAEAAYEGLLTTTVAPKTLYQEGITASFEAVGLTDAQAATYYSQTIPFVSWDASTVPASQNAVYAGAPGLKDAKIQAIITQKWIALNGYGNLEAYNELRRTGFPAGVPSSVDPAAISPTTPIRVLYPTSEYAQNPANVAAQGTISPFTSKIFWMVATNFNTKQ